MHRPILLLAFLPPALAAPAFGQTHDLSEAPDAVTERVGLAVKAEGTLTPRAGEGVQSLPISLAADYRYLERRLPADGFGPTGLKAVRFYGRAGSEIEVRRQNTFARLRDGVRLIVVEGQTRGTVVFSPDGPLRFGEVELLETPADSLLVPALLPVGPVAVGETWSPPDWLAPALCGVEAVEQSELTCTLAAVSPQNGRPTAAATVRGSVRGVAEGVEVAVELDGTFTVDLNLRRLTRLVLTQKQARTVGVVTPGLDITLTATLTREAADDAEPLTEATLARAAAADGPREVIVPLENGAVLTLGRDWRLHLNTPRATLLFLLERGLPVCELTARPVPATDPGGHLPVEQFREDMRRALGDRLSRIDTEARVETGDDRFLYLIRGTGTADERPRVWDYYLLADARGRQASLVFAYDPGRVREMDGLAQRVAAAVRFVNFP